MGRSDGQSVEGRKRQGCNASRPTFTRPASAQIMTLLHSHSPPSKARIHGTSSSPTHSYTMVYIKSWAAFHAAAVALQTAEPERVSITRKLASPLGSSLAMRPSQQHTLTSYASLSADTVSHQVTSSHTIARPQAHR